jgi:hypothetical protein
MILSIVMLAVAVYDGGTVEHSSLLVVILMYGILLIVILFLSFFNAALINDIRLIAILLILFS